jgi:hypothetical protein
VAEGSDLSELWIDFMADTGDSWEATQTLAWLLAQGKLPCAGEQDLPRADLLLLGGDQVYPAPGEDGVGTTPASPCCSAASTPWSRRPSSAPSTRTSSASTSPTKGR